MVLAIVSEALADGGIAHTAGSKCLLHWPGTDQTKPSGTGSSAQQLLFLPLPTSEKMLWDLKKPWTAVDDYKQFY